MYGRKGAGTFPICSVGPRTPNRHASLISTFLAGRQVSFLKVESCCNSLPEAQPYSDDIANLQNVLLLPGATWRHYLLVSRVVVLLPNAETQVKHSICCQELP